MQFINWAIQLMRRHAVLLMTSMAVTGFFMLYLSVQNDFHSSALFLFKAIFLPLSLMFLVKMWLMALLVTKTITRKGQARPYRKWPLGVALLVSLVFLPQLLPNWQRNINFSEQANEQGFKVATFSAMTRSRNAQDIKTFIQAHQPQVLCLQEVTDEDLQILSDMYPFQAKHGGAGLVILSQFPHKKPVDIDEESPEIKLVKNPIQSVEVEFSEQQRIRILNIHMPRQYRKGDGYFSKSLEAIRLHADTTLPIIFCGDFNTTPRNTLYTHLTQQLGFVDAQHNQAWQYGFTFPNDNRRLALFGTWLRIDYLFSRGFLGGATQVINVSNLSDHKAVLSTFLLADK